MLRSSVIRVSAILVAFLSISYDKLKDSCWKDFLKPEKGSGLPVPPVVAPSNCFSARESKGRWMKTTGKTDGRPRERQSPANEADNVYNVDRWPAFAILGVGESVMSDPAQSKRDEDLFRPEAEYLLKRGQRKKKTGYHRKTDSLSRNTDSLLRNTDSLDEDLHYILKKLYKRKILENQPNKLKYLNSDLIDNGEPLKSEDEVDDENNEYEEDPDSWTPEEQLEKDYVHVARSTIGFLRQSRRQPGSSSGSLQAVVDLLVVVDNAIYRRALQRTAGDHNKAIDYIKKYYGIVVSLVDSRYAQIEDKELSIRVRLVAIHISKEKSDSPWSEENKRPVKHSLHLDPNVGLERFHEWLRENHRKLPKFDHAMAFTGYSLVTPQGKHTSGMAYIGTICKVSDGYACSIIQEDGGLSSVSTAVHELGHSLGAKHDGEGSNAVCSATQNYIMAPGNSAEKELLKNFFVFSPCSVREFKALLSAGEADCLVDSSPVEISSLPGKEISPDDQCKDVFGQESGSCEVEDGQPPDEICARLWCVKPGKVDSCITRGHLTAVLGTPCADGKVCKNGECLEERRVLESLRGTGNSRNQTAVTNRISSAPKQQQQHRPSTVTERPVKTELGRPKCKEDVFPDYCRKTIYQRPDLCERSNMAANCCFSCSYVSHSRR